MDDDQSNSKLNDLTKVVLESDNNIASDGVIEDDTQEDIPALNNIEQDDWTAETYYARAAATRATCGSPQMETDYQGQMNNDCWMEQAVLTTVEENSLECGPHFVNEENGPECGPYLMNEENGWLESMFDAMEELSTDDNKDVEIEVEEEEWT